MTDADLPVLLGFVADLMAETRLESAAASLGLRTAWIAQADGLDESAPAAAVEPAPDRSLGEPLLGREARLIERLTRLRPALIVFDLGNAGVPWRDWLSLIKSSPATRRYPVVCYGPHVEGELLREAGGRGADAVLARSAFFGDLAGVIEKYARRIDRAALLETCRLPLSARAVHGLELFNRGAYFEAHEELETAWNEDDTPGRDLYRGILQVAVAYLHVERGNYNGAVKLFLRMRQWLDPLPGVCRGVQLERLRQDAQAVYERLLAGGPQGIGGFDRRLFKPVVYSTGGGDEAQG
ncbi:MAG: DUF309 domain-containing protein [Chloroflexota bacterium]